MKASEIRPGDWVITGGSITDTVRYVRDYPDAGVIVTTETGEERSYHPDAEVSAELGERIVRPTSGTVQQLIDRGVRLRHALRRLGLDPASNARADAIITAKARVTAATEVWTEPHKLGVDAAN